MRLRMQKIRAERVCVQKIRTEHMHGVNFGGCVQKVPSKTTEMRSPLQLKSTGVVNLQIEQK